jgi:hypothetical protein
VPVQRHVAVLASVVGALILLGPVAQAHVFTSGIRVDATYRPTADRITGRIESSSPECVDGRRLRILYLDDGHRSMAGSTRTRPGGRWKVGHLPDAASHDAFRVVVPQSVGRSGAGHRHTCRSFRMTLRV